MKLIKGQLIIIAICLLSFNASIAQNQSVGLTFDYGVSYAKSAFLSDSVTAMKKPSFNIGIYHDLPISKNWGLHFKYLWFQHYGESERTYRDPPWIKESRRSFISIPILSRYRMKGFNFDVGLSNNFTVNYKFKLFNKEKGSSSREFEKSYGQKLYILGASASVGYNVYNRFYLNLKAVHLFLKEGNSKVKNMQYTIGMDFRLK